MQNKVYIIVSTSYDENGDSVGTYIEDVLDSKPKAEDKRKELQDKDEQDRKGTKLKPTWFDIQEWPVH